MTAGVSEGAAIGGGGQEASPATSGTQVLPLWARGPLRSYAESLHPGEAAPGSTDAGNLGPLPPQHSKQAELEKRPSPWGRGGSPGLLPLDTLALGQGLSLGASLPGRPSRAPSPILREGQRPALGHTGRRSRAETHFRPGVSSSHRLCCVRVSFSLVSTEQAALCSQTGSPVSPRSLGEQGRCRRGASSLAVPPAHTCSPAPCSGRSES